MQLIPLPAHCRRSHSFTPLSDVLTGNLLATTVLARSHQASSAPHAVVACLPCGPGGCRVATTLVTLPEPQQGAGLSASAALPRVNAIRIAAHVVAGQLPLLQLDFGEGASKMDVYAGTTLCPHLTSTCCVFHSQDAEAASARRAQCASRGNLPARCRGCRAPGADTGCWSTAHFPHRGHRRCCVPCPAALYRPCQDHGTVYTCGVGALKSRAAALLSPR